MAKHFRELRCWQLATSLRREVNAICAKSEVSKDFKFCDSFRETAASVCHNLSEGFTRFQSAWIVMFFDYALGSVAELQDHLEDCLDRKFIDQATFDRLNDQAEHVKATALNFSRPHRDPTKPPTRRRSSRRRRRRGT